MSRGSPKLSVIAESSMDITESSAVILSWVVGELVSVEILSSMLFIIAEKKSDSQGECVRRWEEKREERREEKGEWKRKEREKCEE